MFLISLLAALASIAGAGLTFYYYQKNLELSKEIASRTVTLEAQQMLLEINKQYLADPALFAVYDDWEGRDELLKKGGADLPTKLKALAYLKLNVFEVVFAVMPPNSPPYSAWMAYFEDTLSRCSVVRDELSANSRIYHPNLIEAYSLWTRKSAKGAPKAVTIT
jgi:hypothetical protein